ncbi:MAG: DnaJ domain-containing protein [Deltaproteobacteria bacterium]|nr:DnaJ domain-containing protein [Deltaproteobacteria bacterium]
MAEVSVFLRDKSGAPVGPITQRALEALAATRVIDESTPVSKDGVAFAPLGQHPDLKRRVLNVLKSLMDEVDPWLDIAVAPAPAAAAAAKPAPAAAPRAAKQNFGQMVEDKPAGLETILKVLFRHAASRAKGRLVITSGDGMLDLRYIDGKIVAFDTDVPYLALGTFLLQGKICDAAAISTGKQKAATMGGDLGGALVMLGLLPPHTFMEQLPNWVRKSLVGSLGWSDFSSDFTEMDIPNPPIPLGLERFRVFSQILDLIEKQTLDAWFDKRLRLPLIRSGVEGASFDDVGLDPKSLRVLRSVDGTKTGDDILKNVGGRTEHQLSALRALYFATQVGLSVFGEDQRTPEEQKQARKLDELREKLEKSNHFDVLGVTAKSTDDEVTSKYKEFAKKYHPDMLKEGAIPELLEARAKLFDTYRRSYDALKDQKKRESYQLIVDKGYDPTLDEQQIVRNVLQAEVEFKKAEALIRLRKYSDAVDILNRAEQLKPDDVEIKLFKVYAKIMNEKPTSSGTQAAIEEIRVHLKANPKIMMGFVFLARLYKMDEQPAKAAKAWKLVIELDPKNNEATSELRLMRMREEKDKKKGIFG